VVFGATCTATLHAAGRGIRAAAGGSSVDAPGDLLAAAKDRAVWHCLALRLPIEQDRSVTTDVAENPPDAGFDAFLADARQRLERGQGVSVSIRTLIRHVGAERRGTQVIGKVQRALDRHGLVTEPSFARGWVDNRVELVLAARQTEGQSADAPSTTAPADAVSVEVSLTVRNLKSATDGLKSVQRNSDLPLARALMLRYDYSQLAVMAGEREIVGAVSWDSMALAAIRNAQFTLADATIPARSVELDDDLIELIPVIAEKGFVLVRGKDRKPSGIVTTADLSLEFATRAGPFLAIGEIERRLRVSLANHFTVPELAQVRDPADTNRSIESVHDLTLGETLRMLENPSNWDRLGWPVDRPEFINALNDVKAIRNDVMHFGPDPLSPEQVEQLSNFVGWLRAMEPVEASTG
jgi:CBS domain-containing protein